MESVRPNHLFNDPWAATLAGSEGEQWLAHRKPDSVLPIILRTRFFDDFLEKSAREFDIRQVVLLAAGFDTRAYRLNWPPGTIVFELDQPAVLQYKTQVLQEAKAQAAASVRRIGQDLTGAWQDALLSGGFEARRLSVWLLEGFLFYLPSEDITGILQALSTVAAPGSWLGFDIINSSMLTHPLTRSWVEMQAASGAPWIGTLDDPESVLSSLGWQADLTQAGQADANHERWTMPVLPTRMPGVPHNWFVTARKVAS